MLDAGYDVIGEMDADGSHQPEQLHLLLDALTDADLVIGSRWVPGGSVTNWPRSRELLSRGGNLYVRLLLGISVRDATAGYRLYRRTALEQIDLDAVESTGYVFQTDLVARTVAAGLRVREVPIEFVERVAGESKMSGPVALRVLAPDHRGGGCAPGWPDAGPAHGGADMSRRRGGVLWILLIAFVVVPLAEIYVLIQVGSGDRRLVDDHPAGARQPHRRLAGQAGGWPGLAGADRRPPDRPDAGPGAGRRRADPGRRHPDADARAS